MNIKKIGVEKLDVEVVSKNLYGIIVFIIIVEIIEEEGCNNLCVFFYVVYKFILDDLVLVEEFLSDY